MSREALLQLKYCEVRHFKKIFTRSLTLQTRADVTSAALWMPLGNLNRLEEIN